MTDKPRYIIGIDLGDGESSLAYVSVDAQDNPQIFEFQDGERSVITAYAESVNGEPLIGNRALLEDEVFRLDINFKQEPDPTSPAWRVKSNKLLRFIEEFYLSFKKARPEIAEQAQIYIGRPSSWSARGVAEYRDLFRSSKYLPEVEVEPESRSAFIQVRDHYIRDDAQLDSVLIVDIGSSTTDVTYVEYLDAKEIHVGSDFGARLIDDLIYEQVIKQDRDSAALKKWLEEKPKAISYLLFLCRMAKEMYFTREPFEPRPKTEYFRWIAERCWPFLKHLDIEAILTYPIKDSGRNWKEGFKQLLIQAREEYRKQYDKQLSPDVVILTGGGSRMPFTKDICQVVFAEASISPDPEPSFAVCRGLAGLGRWRYRVDQFRKEIEEFYQSDQLEQEVRKYIDPFGKEVAKLLHTGVTDGVWRPLSLGLRDGTISADEIGDFKTYYYQQISQWLETPEGKRARDEVIDQFTSRINPFLMGKTNEISDRYHIERSSLRLALTLRFKDIYEGSNALSAFTSDVQFKYLEWLIKGADRIVPVWARKLVPDGVVEGVLNLEKFLKDISEPITQFAEFSPLTREEYVAEIRKQIKEQVEEKAKKVEKWLK